MRLHCEGLQKSVAFLASRISKQPSYIYIILRSRPLSVLDETSQKHKYNPINCYFQMAK